MLDGLADDVVVSTPLPAGAERSKPAEQAQNVVALRQQCKLREVFTTSGGIVKKPSAANKVVNGQLQSLLLKLQTFKSWHVNPSRRCFLAIRLILRPFGVSQQRH